MAKTNKTAGIKEIAERSGVSIGTVDRVLNNRKGVSEATKKKVLEIARELDYQPNILARRLASKKSYSVAVIVPHVTKENPYWELHKKGFDKAESEFRQFGINLQHLSFEQNNLNTFREQLKKALNDDYDGVIMIPVFYKESINFVAECRKKEIPCFFIDTNIPEAEKSGYIGQDPFQSGYLAASLLSLTIGPKDPVLVVNIAKETDSHVNFLLRENGFREYFKEMDPERTVLKMNDTTGDDDIIARELDRLLHTHPVKGIFATNTRAYKVGRYLKNKKVKDIRLIGYDLVEANIKYLERGHINFLISQKPIEQAYIGVQSLYKNLILKEEIKSNSFMPIDIIMKHNIKYYI